MAVEQTELETPRVDRNARSLGPAKSACSPAPSGLALKNRTGLFVGLALGILTLGIYWPVVSHDFVNFDDRLYVTENPVVQQGLTLQGMAWAFRTCHASNWHPVVWFSHMLDCSLFGLNPAGHHLTSLLLHVLNTVLLFVLLRRLTGSIWRSGIVAALFGWHPLHVESVAWIAERKDLLSTLFWILTLWAYATYVERPNWRRYSAALLLFALGLMTKPMLVTVPLVLLILDYWPLRRWSSPPSGASWSELLKEKIPFFALSAGLSVVTIWAQHEGHAIKSLDTIPMFLRATNAACSYGLYLWKTVWPVHLAIPYPMPSQAPVEGALLAGLVLALISIFALRQWQRQPAILAGWLWYLLTLLPVIGLVQAGAQAMADRYTYVPLIGLFIAAAWGLGEINVALPLRNAFAGVALAVFAFGTIHQLAFWQNGATLFAHTIRETRGNYVAHNNLGSALSAQGRTAEAMAQFTEALRINPNYAPAHFNLATDFAEHGQRAEAIQHLRAILGVNPNEAEVHNNLGVRLAEEGEFGEAVSHFNTAIALKPDYVKARLNLGRALEEQGKTTEAIARYRLALEAASRAGDKEMAATIRERLEQCLKSKGAHELQ